MSSEKKAQISVIVPVYKVEPYLRCCIDSILTQTFKNFELILVDDGSPDNCGAICDEYAEKDERIIVIHQKNGGLSAARNTGLDWVFANSSSQWITFVDSDDAIVPTCLETFYRHAEEIKVDMVSAKGYDFRGDTELGLVPHGSHEVRCMSGRDSCISFYRAEGTVSVYAWGKLYNKSLFASARFPEGKLFEDEALTPQIIYNSSQIAVLDAWLYCYRQREDSIVHVPFNLHRFDHLEGIDSCIQFLKQNNENDIALLAEKRKQKYVAKYVLLAHGAKLTADIPSVYRMPIWKAFCITFADTLRQGGIKHILVRIRQFVRRIKR